MSKIKHICFIVPNYPTDNEPVYTFVRELVRSIADSGVKCSVIAPTSVFNQIIKSKEKRDFYWQDITEEGNYIDVYQPKMISLSNLKIFGTSLSSMIRKTTIMNAYNSLKLNPDILYGHFWESGFIASAISEKKKVPVFVATGESEIRVHRKFSKRFIKKYLKNITGVISVSTKNELESQELGLIASNNKIVIPNAVNGDVFYPIDKKEARNKLGLKAEDFIIAFTGAFSERKGIMRISQAIDRVPDVKAIYIGSGELKPDDKNALFIGKLPHHQIPLYLNAADVFVLPTLAEGCSNALIEAMACGLPIISSDRPFNDDVLTEENSIRVDPLNIEEIRQAITLLKEDKELREKMSKASLEISEPLKIEIRANKIINFMEKTLME